MVRLTNMMTQPPFSSETRACWRRHRNQPVCKAQATECCLPNGYCQGTHAILGWRFSLVSTTPVKLTINSEKVTPFFPLVCNQTSNTAFLRGNNRLPTTITFIDFYLALLRLMHGWCKICNCIYYDCDITCKRYMMSNLSRYLETLG